MFDIGFEDFKDKMETFTKIVKEKKSAHDVKLTEQMNMSTEEDKEISMEIII